MCVSSPRETQRYDSVGPVDPSAVIKGFDLSSVRPGIPRHTSASRAAQNGHGWSRAPSHSPTDTLFISSRSRCNIHRIEIDLELDSLLDLSRVSRLLSRISKVPGKRNYFFK